MRKVKQAIAFTCLISLMFFYFCNRLVYTFINLSNNNILSKISISIEKVMTDISSDFFFISLNKECLIGGVVGSIIVWLVYLYKAFDTKNYMPGKEHGSAEWGTEKDIKPFIDKEDFSKNMIFTETEKMTIDTRQTLRNNNICVQGGSGQGKTRFILKPNLMQMHSSYVITDPKGTILPECGQMLADNGYKIKTFNIIDFKKSMHYNPFAYIKEEKDILKLVNTIIINTEGEGEKVKEDFWVKSERLLYQALIGYIWYELPEEEQNFATMLYMINQMETKEDDEEFKNGIDFLFDDLEKKDDEHFAVRQYKKFKMAAGKTTKSILISCGARLSPFDIKQIREITEYDELELETIGEEKTALFVITDDTDKTFNFIVAMLYTQMFNALCNKADKEYNGRLPIHVRCLLDEFANTGKIPDFQVLIATIRSREISAVVFLQNISQLKALYDKHAGTIVGNCDTVIFLGSGEEETQKAISAKVGKATIDHVSINESKGQNGNFTLNQQIISRELITPAEVGLLDRSECLCFIGGVKPFKSKKFDITKHENYKLLSDYDEKNRFDIRKYNEDSLFDNVEDVEEINLNLSDLGLDDEDMEEINALAN